MKLQGTPRKFWWRCGAQFFKSLPYCRSNFKYNNVPYCLIFNVVICTRISLEIYMNEQCSSNLAPDGIKN